MFIPSLAVLRTAWHKGCGQRPQLLKFASTPQTLKAGSVEPSLISLLYFFLGRTSE